MQGGRKFITEGQEALDDERVRPCWRRVPRTGPAPQDMRIIEWRSLEPLSPFLDPTDGSTYVLGQMWECPCRMRSEQGAQCCTIGNPLFLHTLPRFRKPCFEQV